MTPTSEQLARALEAEQRRIVVPMDRRGGTSTAVMPNGNYLCLSHSAPDDLWRSMVAVWAAVSRFSRAEMDAA